MPFFETWNLLYPAVVKSPWSFDPGGEYDEQV